MIDTPRLAIIGSSGGAAVAAANQILGEIQCSLAPLIITDRSCGFEDWGHRNAYPTLRIPFVDKVNFSAAVAHELRTRGIKHVLLMFTRLVGEPLLSEFEVNNIHPSLLPHFPGLGAVRQAHAAGATTLGCSLHVVDEGMDTGKLIAQVSCPLSLGVTLKSAERLSYLQKVWLVLFWWESTQERGAMQTCMIHVRHSRAVEWASSTFRRDSLAAAYRRWSETLDPIA